MTTKIVEAVAKLDSLPRCRRLFGIYLGTASLMMGLQTYEDGKQALMKKRAKNDQNDKTTDMQTVRYGCSEYWFGNLISSIVFPITWVRNVIPYMVVKINQPPMAEPSPPSVKSNSSTD